MGKFLVQTNQPQPQRHPFRHQQGTGSLARQAAPDCICVQEVKAQAADVAGKFETLAGLKGHFHFAEKKGYSGVASTPGWSPATWLSALTRGEFDAEGRYVELRFDTPGRKHSIISAYFPSGSSGEERQQAKFRFLADVPAPGSNSKAARLHPVRRCQHRPQGDRPEELAQQPEEQRLPARRARLDDQAAHWEGGLVDVYRQLQPDTTDTCYTWWSNRGQAYANNVGWRLDYHLATQRWRPGPHGGHLQGREVLRPRAHHCVGVRRSVLRNGRDRLPLNSCQ
jgi:exodeoxyribonuclease-3